MKTKSIGIAICGALILFGCVDINLKSEMPKIEYYDLASPNTEDKKCDSYDSINLSSVKIASQFDTQAIMTLDTNTLISGSKIDTKWASSPKNMYRIALLDNLQNKCYSVSNKAIKNGIEIEILRFEILVEEDSQYAFIYMNAKVNNVTKAIKIKRKIEEDFALGFKVVIEDSVTEIIKMIK